MFVSLSHEINEKWQLVLLFCPVVLPVGSSLVKSIVWHHHAPFRHKTKHVTHTKTCFKNVFHCTTVKPIHTWSIEVPFNQPYACIMSFGMAVDCWNWLKHQMILLCCCFLTVTKYCTFKLYWYFIYFELKHPLYFDCKKRFNFQHQFQHSTAWWNDMIHALFTFKIQNPACKKLAYWLTYLVNLDSTFECISKIVWNDSEKG